MKACARISATADGRGVTRLTELYGEAPLLPRLTGPEQVHLVGGAAGPLGGDRLRLEVTVADGARLTMRTVAATVALRGCGQSVLEVAVRVGRDASLRWLPEPLIAAAGCDHRVVSTVELDAGARLVWREELILGRHGESPGDVSTALRVRLDGVPLVHQELAAGPRSDGWAGAAVLGDERTVGSLLLVNPEPPDPATAGNGRVKDDPAVVGAWMSLAGPGYLGTAVAADAHTLRAWLDARVGPTPPARVEDLVRRHHAAAG